MPGQRNRDPVTGAHVQRLPTIQRTEAQRAHASIIQLDRSELQQRCDPPGAADAKFDVAHLGQRLAQRVLPGCGPVGLGLPALGRRTLLLAQHHAIGGERQRLAIPVLAPVAGVFQCLYGLAERLRIGEAECRQLPELGVHAVRAVRPVPDEQADPRGSVPVQAVAGHGAGHAPASPRAAMRCLDMPVQSPVELALQDDLVGYRQARRDRRQSAGIGCPVLSGKAIATADGLLQGAVTIDQGDRDTVDLGLNPQVAASRDPGRNRLLVGELDQAGLSDRMAQRTAGFLQRIRCRAGADEAAPPAVQLRAALVIDLVVHQRLTAPVIGIVPLGELRLQLVDLLACPRVVPVRTGGEAGRGEQAQR